LDKANPHGPRGGDGAGLKLDGLNPPGLKGRGHGKGQGLRGGAPSGPKAGGGSGTGLGRQGGRPGAGASKGGRPAGGGHQGGGGRGHRR
jgi:translation initiation factor IF-2